MYKMYVLNLLVALIVGSALAEYVPPESERGIRQIRYALAFSEPNATIFARQFKDMLLLASKDLNLKDESLAFASLVNSTLRDIRKKHKNGTADLINCYNDMERMFSSLLSFDPMSWSYQSKL